MIDLPEPVVRALACPSDRTPLRESGSGLACERGHAFPVVRGVPVLLLPDRQATHPEGARALDLARHADDGDPLLQATPVVGPGEIDPFVQTQVGATNGRLFAPLIGRLREYPIPRLEAPGPGETTFLELGCNWGRWCLAAARSGWLAVGIDPSLRGVLAARRVARQLGLPAWHLVADARALPFQDGAFDRVFSFSVLQHLAKANAWAAFAEAGRVVRPGGVVRVQMPNRWGCYSLAKQLARGFRAPEAFEVRYWSPRELRRVVSERVGPAQVSVDAYFTLNAQASEAPLLPAWGRAVVALSRGLVAASRAVPPLRAVADSLWVEGRKPS
jgi:SAM-dependent methyltransferase